MVGCMASSDTGERVLDRRRPLQVGAASGAAVVLSSALGASSAGAATPDLRVYVLVVDGSNPAEFALPLMPRLAALRAEGAWFPQARSLPVMETIPNHVTMMTGVRPDRSGVPANSVFDRAEGVVRDLDRPTDLRFPTLLERLRETGRTTGTVLSREYLYGIFGERATHRWEPAPIVPGSGHALDVATVDAAIAMVEEFDPSLIFVNLGDVDRVGHSDITGAVELEASRRAALLSTDTQMGRFVDHLRTTGRWATSVLLMLADHSMDWSITSNLVSVAQVLATRPDLRDSITIAQNGGADLLYWTGPADRRDAGLAEVADLVRARPGVLEVQLPAALRPGPEADLVCPPRLAVRRHHPGLQPAAGQPRPPGDRADPVPGHRRAPGGAPRRDPRRPGADGGRRADRRRAVRPARTPWRLRRHGRTGAFTTRRPLVPARR